MSLGELIDKCDTGEPSSTAEAVFDTVSCPKVWRALFWRVVLDECRRRQRSVTRHLEHSATTSQSTNDTQRGAAGGGGKSRDEWLASGFYSGQRWVTWGAALVADHEDRIDYLESYRDGLARTVAKHVEAVHEITSAGVSCLADLPGSER